MSLPEERCVVCDDPTGRAGAGEDSVYWLALCDDCNRKLREEALSDEGTNCATCDRLAAVEAERDRLRTENAGLKAIAESAIEQRDQLERQVVLMRGAGGYLMTPETIACTKPAWAQCELERRHAALVKATKKLMDDWCVDFSGGGYTYVTINSAELRDFELQLAAARFENRNCLAAEPAGGEE